MRRRLMMVMACIGFAPVQASAQWQWSTLGHDTMISDISHQSHIATMRANPVVDEETGPETAKQEEEDRAALLFAPSLTRRAANIASFTAKSRAVDPVGADALERLFSDDDVFGQLSAALEPLGLRVDSLSDAYAVWWMSAWEAANGSAGVTTRDMAQAVRGQAEAALLAVPQVASADDTDKQQLAEALLIQAMLLKALQEAYADDPVHGPRLRAATLQGAKDSGLDLSTMTLTEDGFVTH